MKIATIIARILLGLLFVMAGVTYFFTSEPMDLKGDAAAFAGALAASGYMTAVKVLEILGGALTASGRYTPTGLLILGPIIVNIAFFHIFLARNSPPMVIAIGLMALFLLYAYRKNFAGLLCCKNCDAS